MLLDHISQRDVSYGAGIDQYYLPGISVNAMGSDWQSWMQTCAAIGFKAFYMDFTWDNINSNWSLCPSFDSRSYNVSNCATLYNVSTVLSDYITQTDTNLGVDLLKLSLRFRVATELTPSDFSAMNKSNFFDEIEPIASRILSTTQVVSGQGTSLSSNLGTNNWNPYTLWPSLQSTLLTAKNRVVLSVDTEHLPFNTTFTPLNGIAFNSLHTVSQLAPIRWPKQQLDNTTTTIIDFDALASDPFRSLNIQIDELRDTDSVVSAWVSAMDLGYSPVLNGTITNDTLYELATYYQWPWSAGAPELETGQDRQWLLSNQNYSMCAAQTTNGWRVGNCHAEGRILCLNNTNRFDWAFADGYTPFTATEDNSSCPPGYTFAPPVTHLQSIAVRQAMANNNISWAWTSINSLSVENCWVNGVNTVCPYNIVQGDRNGVALLTVVSAIGFGLIILMIFLEYWHLNGPLMPPEAKKKVEKGTKSNS